MIVVLVLITAVLSAGHSFASQHADVQPFSPGRAAFAVKVRNETIPYREFTIPVLPGERIELAVEPSGPDRSYSLQAGDSPVIPVDGYRWSWTSPESPGIYDLLIGETESAETMTLHILVMVPAERVAEGRLNGYLIGEYPKIVFRNLAEYRPPQGFVEVTAENRELRISPHFLLGQFLCKQEGGYPKYVVIRERLLLKLEYLLEQVNRAGYRCDSFAILSGYRTPHYNRLIRNVKYSRHMWGGAADIFVDESPRDGEMDDLNGDGKNDVEDARLLYAIIDSNYGRSVWERFLGGLGLYERNSRRGPFVHVDARGYRARWGD